MMQTPALAVQALLDRVNALENVNARGAEMRVSSEFLATEIAESLYRQPLQDADIETFARRVKAILDEVMG